VGDHKILIEWLALIPDEKYFGALFMNAVGELLIR